MILLDTCALLWLSADQEKLSSTAKTQIRQSAGGLMVSAISAFEIGLKHQKKKLSLPRSPEIWFREVVRFHGLKELPVSSEIAVQSTLLPNLHRDPCDRFLIATALLGDYKIVTPDHLIRAYPNIETIW